MKFFTSLLFILLIGQMSYAQNFLQPIEKSGVPSSQVMQLKLANYQVLLANNNSMAGFLYAVQEGVEHAVPISLPTPDGSYRKFKIWQTPMMEDGLAARYPEIKTFTAVALDNKAVTAKLDITLKGFHAIVYDGANTYFIDPYSALPDDYYTCYYKREALLQGAAMACEVTTAQQEEIAHNTVSAQGSGEAMKVNGVKLRRYRLALACTGEYAVAVCSPSAATKPLTLSAMVTSVNRVSGVYEREVAVRFQLIANDDTLIYLNGGTDPYTNNSGSNMLGENQTNITTIIGTANFDMGHVFSTGGGGVATLSCICNSSQKARGVTGLSNPVGDAFNIDYVAHEMGHQFSGQHTFNASTGSCSGNGVSSSAFEPASGITIMAYAGICGVVNNLAPHSIPYFHARSLDQISTFISGSGGTCADSSISGNTPSSIGTFTNTYKIPKLTPFELTAPTAIDPTADTLTYSWEECDLGNFGVSWPTVRINGPIFKSFSPTISPTRVFPILDSLLLPTPVISYLGEKLPDTSRILRFKLTVRDIFNGIGCFNFPTDTVFLNVINTPRGFTVSMPDTGFTRHWMGNHTDTVKWDVAGTDTSAVACTNVDIYLSVDSGRTYPITIMSGAPNTGMALVTVPNILTNKARIKVKGANNVFFDISNANFSIDTDTTTPPVTAIKKQDLKNNVNIYPVPAKDKLHIYIAGGLSAVQVNITNAMGQSVWEGQISGAAGIDVSKWANGVYYVTLLNTDSGEKLVKPVVIQ